MTSSNDIRFPHTPTRSDSTHPYAIVTTSTALLTRSNSTNKKILHHSYSPSPLPSFSSPTSHRHDYRGHRHTRSCTSLPSPPPSLPAPPSSEDEDDRRWRNNSWTDFETSSESENESDLQLDALGMSNPKHWDTMQLCEYLMSQNHGDLAEFVKAEHLTGRSFLRFSPSCMSPNLAESLNDDQIGTVIEQARKLRILALKSRIWGLQNTTAQEENDSPIASPVTRLKVKGMVQAFENGSHSVGLRTRTDSTASSDSEWRANSPLERRARGPRNASEENGFASASESDSNSYFVSGHTPSNHGVKLASAETEFELRTPSPSVEHAEPFVRGPSDENLQELSVAELLSQGVVDDGTMNRLTKSWGAKAWEEDNLGATARRIPLSPPTEGQCPDEFGILQFNSMDANDDRPKTSQEALMLVPEEESVPDTDVLALHADAPAVIEKLEDVTLVESPAPAELVQLSDTETVEELKARLAVLEARIQGLERSKAVNDEQVITSSEPASPIDMDLPQYLLMAGVGVCAIIGQAVLRKFMRV